MTREKAKEKGYTHLVEFFGYRAYFNTWTGEIEGTSWVNDKMIMLCVYFYKCVYQNLLPEDQRGEYWKIIELEEL